MLNLERQDAFKSFARQTYDWIESVGIPEVEARGIYRAGDFWEVWLGWVRRLEVLEDRFCKMEPKKIEEISIRDLGRIFTNFICTEEGFEEVMRIASIS